MKIFYWDKETGWKIRHQLEKAAEDPNLDEDTRYVAQNLLMDGCPSVIGYSLRMNEFYMEHFIYIITGGMSNHLTEQLNCSLFKTITIKNKDYEQYTIYLEYAKERYSL